MSIEISISGPMEDRIEKLLKEKQGDFQAVGGSTVTREQLVELILNTGLHAIEKGMDIIKDKQDSAPKQKH